MPTLTTITTRPTTSIDWFEYPSAIAEHQKTLKIASSTRTLSEDGLLMTREKQFKTQEDLDTFLNDTVLSSVDHDRAVYNTLHNITFSTTIS